MAMHSVIFDNTLRYQFFRYNRELLNDKWLRTSNSSHVTSRERFQLEILQPQLFLEKLILDNIGNISP
jgi:hypothetical protein